MAVSSKLDWTAAYAVEEVSGPSIISISQFSCAYYKTRPNTSYSTMQIFYGYLYVGQNNVCCDEHIWINNKLPPAGPFYNANKFQSYDCIVVLSYSSIAHHIAFVKHDSCLQGTQTYDPQHYITTQSSKSCSVLSPNRIILLQWPWWTDKSALLHCVQIVKIQLASSKISYSIHSA